MANDIMSGKLTIIPELTSFYPLRVGEGQVLRSKTRERFVITGDLKGHNTTINN